MLIHDHASSDSPEPLPDGLMKAPPTPAGAAALNTAALPSTPRDLTLDQTPTDELLKPTWPIHHVRTPRQLAALAAKLERAELFSVDTETWGPRVLSDILCLIQISIPPGELHRRKASPLGETHLIDVTALEAAATAEGKGRNPLQPLKKLLEDDSTLKIVHHAQFETAQFEKYGIELHGVIDTKTTAKKIRPDLVSHSLQACVFEILGREMSKEEQTSKWIQRPLTAAQIDYAALDSEIVLHLLEKLRELEGAIAPSPDWGLDTLIEKLGETKRAREALFDSAGAATALETLDGIAAARRATLTNILTYEASHGVTANYRGPYGTAQYKCLPVEAVCFDKVRELIPNLAPRIIRETTTKKALGSALADLGRTDELELIWDEICIENGARSTPRLVIELAGEAPARRTAAPRKKSGPSDAPPADASKETLLRELLEAEIGRLQVIRAGGLGDQLAILDGRMNRYAERILELLEAQAPDPSGMRHSGPHGSASFTTRPTAIIDIAGLKLHYPEVAARCLTETITKGRLAAVLRESGADPKTCARITAQIFQRTGQLGPPRISISPNYALFYKGVELDPEAATGDDDTNFDEAA